MTHWHLSAHGPSGELHKQIKQEKKITKCESRSKTNTTGFPASLYVSANIPGLHNQYYFASYLHTPYILHSFHLQ